MLYKTDPGQKADDYINVFLDRFVLVIQMLMTHIIAAALKINKYDVAYTKALPAQSLLHRAEFC